MSRQAFRAVNVPDSPVAYGTPNFVCTVSENSCQQSLNCIKVPICTTAAFVNGSTLQSNKDSEGLLSINSAATEVFYPIITSLPAVNNQGFLEGACWERTSSEA